MSSEPNLEASRSIQQAKPDTAPKLEPAPRLSMAKPSRSLGESVEYYARHAIASLLLVTGVVTMANVPSALNRPAAPDMTGSVPNQPGKHDRNPNPTVEPTQPTQSESQLGQNSWQIEMAQKLDEAKPGDENFVDGAQIISQGEAGVIGVNLRPFAANIYPPGFMHDMADVPELAVLRWGGKVKRGIVIVGTWIDKNGKETPHKFLVFRVSDAEGQFAADQEGNPLPDGTLSPDTVVAAAYPYYRATTQTQAPTP